MSSSFFRRMIALALGVVAGAATAGFQQVTVDGQSGPWNWTAGGQNGAYNYGPTPHDFKAPTVVDLASIGSGFGKDLFILYKSGKTSAFGNPTPPGDVDQAGYVGSVFKDNDPGSSGGFFPSLHMSNNWGVNQEFPTGTPVSDPENYGVFLQALVAALTDDLGSVLNPFPVGYVIPVSNGVGGYTQGIVFGLSFQVTTVGATKLSLGMNDDIFSDNTGSLQVCVASSQADMDRCIRGSRVPEPGTVLLLGGAALAAAVLRRRREPLHLS